MIIFIGAFLVSFFALVVLLKSNLARIAQDQPNHRSLHTTTTPRAGGLAIMLGILLAYVLIGDLWRWIGLLTCMITVSLIDDIYGLTARWRFAVQLLVSIAFVSFVLPPTPWLYQAIAVLSLVWMTNLYNFMDGSDGLAGGMAVFGFGAFAIAAYLAHNMQLAQMCGAVVAASLAFLIFNFHPAKIFMGDAGSIPLGFLAGAIGLYGWQQDCWPLWFPVLVFSPFIVDATITLLKRALRGEKLWQAHREHYYQRLVQMGWGHKKTAIAEYILMALVVISAFMMLRLPFAWAYFLLLVWAAIYALMMLVIDKKWKRQFS